MADISAATWTEADASNTASPPDGAPEGMLPSGTNNTIRMIMGAIKRFYDHINPTLDSTGSANAQTLSYTVAPTAYVTGDIYGFMVGAGLTNTGATTLNVNGLGAKNIFIGSNTLQGGELRENQFVLVGYDGTQFQLLRGIVPATGGFTPADPTGTTSAAGVMMGIGSTCSITPTVSGAIVVHVVGDVAADAAGSSQMQIRYGSGAAPANAAALTGTTSGSLVAVTTSTANERASFALVGYVTGLTVGTAYWIDIRLSNSTGGTSTVKNLSVVAEERPR